MITSDDQHMEFYKELTCRQAPIIDTNSQMRIRDSRFCIIGIGANGAPAANALARMGAENIVLADPDIVELSNLNRQPYYLEDVGNKKVNCLKENILKINSSVNVETFPEGLNNQNVIEILKDAQIIIDAADDYRAKVELSRNTKELNLPTVHTAGAGWKGSVTTFFPDKTTYEEMFELPSLNRDLNDVKDTEFLTHRKKVAEIIGINMYPSEIIENMDDLNQFWPTLISAAYICGILAAQEAIKIAIGMLNLVISAPMILQVDTMNNRYSLFEFGKDGIYTSYK